MMGPFLHVPAVRRRRLAGGSVAAASRIDVPSGIIVMRLRMRFVTAQDSTDNFAGTDARNRES